MEKWAVVYAQKFNGAMPRDVMVGVLMVEAPDRDNAILAYANIMNNKDYTYRIVEIINLAGIQW